jgi:alkyl sulfatase BDS1-like metallo-beta-lactamase superfamily hydrolase
MALGVRRGLITFVKEYCDASRLTGEQKSFWKGVLVRAHGLSKAERRRMAVTETIEWLRQRVTQEKAGGVGAAGAQTLDAFFDSLAVKGSSIERATAGRQSISFVFGDGVSAGRTVIFDRDRVTVQPGTLEQADLLIRTDPQTWLAVVGGRDDAFDLVRAGRLRVFGDTTLIPMLMDQIDGRGDDSPRAGASSEVGPQTTGSQG